MKKYITYNSLNKEEKKDAIKKFNRTKKGAEVNKIYLRLIIEGIASILIGLGLIVYAIVKKESWIYYLFGGLLIVFGIFFLISEVKLKRKVIEDMLNK